MWDWIVLFLFARTVELTDKPVDLSPNWMEITPAKPIEVLNAGARIEIDVTTSLETELGSPIRRLSHDLPARFPLGSIGGVLITPDGRSVQVTDGKFAITQDRSFVLLTAPGLEKGQQFARVRLRSEATLSGVRILWRNATK